MRIVKRCTDWCGGNFAILRVREVLVLEISTSLTCLCLQNMFGDLLRARVFMCKGSTCKILPTWRYLKGWPEAGSSFTWQGIVAGLTTFWRGYIWRVGKGENINIYTDPWIPSTPNRKIIAPRGDVVYTKVSKLSHQEEDGTRYFLINFSSVLMLTGS
jgi:hypothetical protein